MPSFVAQHRQLDEDILAKKASVDSSKLQGMPLEEFDVVKSHCMLQPGSATTTEDDSVLNCRNRKVLLDLVLAKTARRSTSRDGSNWCGLQ